MRVTLAIVGTALFGLTISTAASQVAEPNVPTLVVVGEAERAGTPDIAILSIGVVAERETAGMALQAASASIRDIIARVRGGGVEARDVQTSGLSLHPKFARRVPEAGSEDRPLIVGYIASNQLTLRIRGLDRVGRLLDEVVSSGSNDLRGLSLDVADREQLLDEARRGATEDAKRKAAVFAAAAGVKLGDIINVQEDSLGVQSRTTGVRSGMLESASPVLLEAGELAFRIRVRITWRIAP
jgi:uncharacterized protein YggE